MSGRVVFSLTAEQVRALSCLQSGVPCTVSEPTLAALEKNRLVERTGDGPRLTVAGALAAKLATGLALPNRHPEAKDNGQDRKPS